MNQKGKIVKLCSECADLFRDAYDVHPVHIGWIPESYGKAGCENCGKRITVMGIYEVTLRKKGKQK